jgi:hypothetical protein
MRKRHNGLRSVIMLISTFGLALIAYLCGQSIVAVLAYEGSTLGDLRLMQAQATLAVFQH